MELRILPQKLVDWVSIETVDINFFEEREVNSVLVVHKGLNLFRGSRLLIVELIARESQNLQALITHCVVHLNQLLVVRIGQSSFRHHIHD